MDKFLNDLFVQTARDSYAIGGNPYPIYWNIDDPLNKNLKRNQRRYKVRNNKVIKMDSPKNIEKAQEELAPF